MYSNALNICVALFIAIIHYNKASTTNVSSTVAESSSAFSRDLFRQLLSSPAAEENKNIVFSPASIQTCVALAFFGAKGKTKTEIATGLHLGTLDKDDVAKRFNNLLTSSKNSPLLGIANKIYINNELHVKEKFNEIAKNAFQSEAESVDFKEGNKTVQKINSWVESKTNNNINNLINSVEPDATMILVNAIHLKAEWQHKFDPHATHKSDFWLTPNSSVKVDFMFDSDYGYGYAEWSDLDAKALNLPYKDSDLSMVIILPNQRGGLESLEEKLSNADILCLANRMPVHEIRVLLPKFKIESKFKLNGVFEKMGMSTMFSNEADFSDLFEETKAVKVSEVVHKAFISVDEDGTEASAATYSKFWLRSFVKPFIANHPFVYFIKSQDYIYFMGHVTKF